MNYSKRWFRILIILLMVVLCILVFLPRQRVIGGLGNRYAFGKTAYREDYTCIGLAVNAPPLFVTADGDTTYLCFGMIMNRVCTIESVTQDETIVRTPVACRD